MRTKSILINCLYAVLLTAGLSSCGWLRAAGDSVEATGEGVGYAVEETGDAVGRAAHQTEDEIDEATYY